MRDPFEGRFEARRTAAVVLAVVAGLLVLGVLKPSVLGTIAVLFGIILMIMLHEAGHYFTAKWSDMKVTEFFLGFGPRLWSVRRGETEYGVKAIPAGGYVRIVGMHNLEEVEPEDEPRTYRSKPYHNRLMVAVAGSVTHFLLAIVMLFAIFAFIGVPETLPVVGRLVEGAPAAAAGIQEGDRVVSVAGERVEEWRDVLGIVSDFEPGARVVVTVERDGERLEIPVVTAQHPDVDDERVAFLGVGPEVVDRTEPLPEAAGKAVADTATIARESLLAVGRFFTPSNLSSYTESLTGAEEPSDDTRFLSPVGATQVASQAVEEGIREVLTFLALINIFVGVFNMLPVPPFDGGHVAIATYEKIASMVKGRPVQVDMAKIMPVAALVVAVLLFIGISALWLDIVRPVDVGF
ncbi:MAG TPA: M50 family metallopeptidase [Acidimicrobiia bacterium]|nr:M50 family metallopeptidase [Acidimicrobiia bacterium]